MKAPKIFRSHLDGDFNRHTGTSGLSLADALKVEQELKAKGQFAITRHYEGRYYVYEGQSDNNELA